MNLDAFLTKFYSCDDEEQFLKDVYHNLKWIQQENKKLKDNWNKLKEYVNKQYDYYMNNKDYIGGRLCLTDIKDKMQELEINNK